MADDEPEQPLSESLMDFSNIGRTIDGSGFAFRAMSCVGKRIGPIKAIEGYSHLQTVDLSQNAIKDVAPLKGLVFVLKLDLSNNAIPSLKGWESEEGSMPHLVHLDLSGNQLTALAPLPLKALRTAIFAKNEIASVQDFGGHERIEFLDLSENKLTSLAGLTALPALKKLDVSTNELPSVEGLSEVPVLEELRMASNKLEALTGPWQDLPSLATLDISGCQLAEAKHIEVLRNLPKLRSLQVQGNPFEEASDVDVRVEVLTRHWRLQVINGEPITPEELEQAKELNVQRLAEEQARLAAEQAAADGGGDDDAG